MLNVQHWEAKCEHSLANIRCKSNSAIRKYPEKYFQHFKSTYLGLSGNLPAYLESLLISLGKVIKLFEWLMFPETVIDRKVCGESCRITQKTYIYVLPGKKYQKPYCLSLQCPVTKESDCVWLSDQWEVSVCDWATNEKCLYVAERPMRSVCMRLYCCDASLPARARLLAALHTPACSQHGTTAHCTHSAVPYCQFSAVMTQHTSLIPSRVATAT